MLANTITFLIISAIITGAIVKMVIDKINGIHCPGCPYSGDCKQSHDCLEQSMK